jgi:hypothetical protein
MIMSFCKKSVHSFLGLTISLDTTQQCHDPNISSSSSSSLSGGLGLITANDMKRSPNVVESSSMNNKPFSLSSSPPKKDPDGNNCGFFLDDIGGGDIVDGLMSCTESLGFESSDERRVEVDKSDVVNGGEDDNGGGFCSKMKKSSKRMKFGEVKKFPPPLSSLNQNGKRSFFLRAVRKEGRLELTEVRLDRSETLRASREDGRLRLHLIQDFIEDEDIEQEQEQEQEEKEDLEVEEEEEEEEEEGVEEEIVEEEWKFPVSGEGLRRCNELVSHNDHHHHHQYHSQYHHHHQYHHHSNHHHNLNVWRQHCVTTG